MIHTARKSLITAETLHLVRVAETAGHRLPDTTGRHGHVGLVTWAQDRVTNLILREQRVALLEFHTGRVGRVDRAQASRVAHREFDSSRIKTMTHKIDTCRYLAWCSALLG